MSGQQRTQQAGLHPRQIAGCLALTLLLLGCGATQGIRPSPAHPTPTPYTGGLDGLQFPSAEAERRMKELDRCMRDIAGPGWTYVSYKQIGNFYQARWCSGAGARRDCVLAESSADNRDQHTVELDTLFYDLPQVFGLDLIAHWVPPAQGWGANFYFSEDGKGILGEGFGVDFFFYDAPTGAPQAKLHLGSDYSYSIYETRVDYFPGLPLREDLARYITSPEAMRERGLAEMDAALNKVEGKIASHQATRCEYGPYKGDGIPPKCTPHLLTTAEEQASITKAQTYWASQKQLLSDNYVELYTTLLKAFPLDRCWH